MLNNPVTVVRSMYKIREVAFQNHPVLGNLDLSFCREDGSAASTVIIAGENGTGKSALMEALYNLFSHSTSYLGFNAEVAIELDGRTVLLDFKEKINRKGVPFTYVQDGSGMNVILQSPDYQNRYPVSAIYSDVDINFQANTPRNVTSMELDAENGSRRSASDLPTQINQLIVDIQAQDDSDFARIAKDAAPNTSIGELNAPQRMPRFTSAFSEIFEDLSYSRVKNKDGHKEILFEKGGREIPIQSLSSGEKQIVYRGAFLLKDANALDGALVFIDEPEISLHPSWQKRILEYYKAIFTNKWGEQTSQIFCVTHSPFIIHNENRKDDKVIVLQRGARGNIEVLDRPEYYECNSLSVVRDAFNLSLPTERGQTVYVEGPTDERYFKKAVEVFALDTPYVFRWIGHDVKGKGPAFTGETALKQGANFLISTGNQIRTAFLFDCDVKNCDVGVVGNVLRIRMPEYHSNRNIKKGIENALVLDNLDISCFYKEKTVIGDYGQNNTVYEPDKIALCDLVCALDDNQARVVLPHLRDMILQLTAFFDTGTNINDN